MKEEEEIEITFQPIKRIVIFECNEFSIEEFFQRIELMAKAEEPIVLNWAEGIVFLYIPYPYDSDVIIKEMLKGTMYWGLVMFAPMPKYQPLKKFGAREIPIIDQSSFSYLRQVAQWLKERIKT